MNIAKKWIFLIVETNGDNDWKIIKAFFQLTKTRLTTCCSKFFYIRYLNNQLRFRFLVPETEENEIKDFLISHLDSLSFKQKISVNNKYFEVYKPEIDRYGGPEFISIAEDQFHLSSEICFQVLNEELPLSYEEVMGKAIQLHLGFAYAVGFSAEESATFFSQIKMNWLGYAMNGIGEDKILQKFERSFEGLKGIEKWVHQIWTGLSKGSKIVDEWFSEWVNGMKKINLAYRTKSDSLQTSIDQVFESFIHMTNNRLGVYNQQESYLAFIIEKSLIMNKI